MTTIILFIILAAAVGGAAVTLLAVVVVGIRQEPRGAELSSRPSGLVAAVVRRMTGLHVRRPDPAVDHAGPREECLAGHATGDHPEGDGR